MIFMSLYILLIWICSGVKGDEKELYNTKLATSDLLWTRHSSQDEGWEEVSSYDADNNIIRSYQICRTNEAVNDNWIRSPYIDARDGKRIHVDVEFSIQRCFSDIDKSAKCKETFNIYYYEASQDVASSTFPPWRENPYVKVDTVAANAAGGINRKTFSFGPLTRKGLYIAIQDQGACMSLSSLRVYFYYCGETTGNLAAFPTTISGDRPASLISVVGECLANAIVHGKEPMYRCTSDGRWQILTGGCHCDVGFQTLSNATGCYTCPVGSYKLVAGDKTCKPCPANSGLLETTSRSTATVARADAERLNDCPCWTGYGRAHGESISLPCSNPPSQPRNLSIQKFNSTSATLVWVPPVHNGGRTDLYYSIECRATSPNIDNLTWKNCSDSVRYVGRRHGGRLQGTQATMTNLRPYTKYKFFVQAHNGVSPSLPSHLYHPAQASITTKQSAPSRVRSVRVTRTRQASWMITWLEPDERNGKIIGYEVELQRKTTSSSIGFLPMLSQTNETSLVVEDLVSGSSYQVHVRAKTSAGFGESSDAIEFLTTLDDATDLPGGSGPNNTMLVVAALCAVIVVLLVLVTVCRYRRTGKLLCLNTARVAKKQQRHEALDSRSQDPYAHERLIVDLPPPGLRIYVEYPDPQKGISRFAEELNFRNITIEETIGTGEFAEVCRGKLDRSGGERKDVAIKRLKKGYSKQDESSFLREASTMAQFDDRNIVRLRGVITKSHPVMIVTEFMENGSLDRYLQLNKGTLTIVQITAMLKGIASGMRYLSSMKYVHRDLAARNILVNSDLVCKVSDFGLSRTLENDPHATYTTQGGKIAIRWTAPECIRYRQFTSASDVWSYGIVMWEVFSYGEKPYWDMSNQEVIESIDRGMRLPSPTECPKPLHDMMLECWSAEPAKRPAFVALLRSIEQLLCDPDMLLTTNPVLGVAQRVDQVMTSQTPNLSRAMDNGRVSTVDQWLEFQRLSGYSDQFRERGLDNLDKVANLTINDLKGLGINVTLHIDTLENGIRTLKRHLSTTSSTQLSSARRSDVSTDGEENCNDSLMLESAEV